MRVPGFSYCRLRRAVEVGCSTELTSLEFESDSSGDSEDVAVRATPNQKRGGREWCRLAYWEGRERVGHEQFSVCSPSVEVFATVSSGNKNVPQQRPGRRRTWLRRNSDSCGGNGSANGGGSGSDARGGLRNKIGRGILLSKDEHDRVWLYNRSVVPIFVQSPALLSAEAIEATGSATPDSPAGLTSPAAVRVNPGFSAQVFDFSVAASLLSQLHRRRRLRSDGPCDVYSVQVSFAKGWGGSNFKRQDVTECPFWLQVSLRPPHR